MSASRPATLRTLSRAGLALVALAPLVAAGCTRNFWRTQADAEASNAIRQLASLTNAPLEYYNVYTDPRSRLFDPTSPDKPPMPPDDPAAQRLMHCINYQPHYLRWFANGVVPSVDLHQWEQYLPPSDNAEGAIPLDLSTAVMLARFNSRDYQQQIETMYLAALDVTFERFRFATQFFATQNTTFDTQGPANPGGPLSTLSVLNDVQAQKLFAGGGQLLVEFANSFVWQFAGPNTQTANSLISFNFLQPLMRGAGRAVVLERLTTAERALLYDVRQMEQYRRAFYAFIATGRNVGQGPTRLGGVFGASGLAGFTGVGGGGFGQVGTAVAATGNVGAGGTTGGAGAAQAQGFIGLVQDIMQIRNQEANVAGLRDSLAQLEAAYEAGRIDRFQVDLTRQQLYTSESQVLNAKIVFENLLDSLKISMGLPPDIRFVVQDPFLERFKLIDPDLTRIQGHVDDLVDEVRNPDGAVGFDDLRTYLADVAKVREEITGHLTTVAEDFKKLDEILPSRRRTMRRLQLRPEFDRGDVEPSAYRVDLLDDRVETLKDDHEELLDRLAGNWTAFTDLEANLENLTPDAARLRLLDVVTLLSGQVLELSLVQARARLDAIELVPIAIQPSQAMAIASANRPDWKNTRAQVIDSWRRIEFNANGLLSGLNVVFSGDLGTTQDNPIRFRDTTGELRVGVQFDAPLTRMNERNLYRQSLIDYQQARRRYMLFVDTVHQLLRQEIRQIDLNQLNFELLRAAVGVAIEKVDLSRLKLMQPPAPGEQAAFSDTFARDLLTSLNDLLNVQNDFMSVWVNYEVQRIGLDFDMGIMQLDDRGVWIDPGPIDGPRLLEQYAGDCEPEDLPFMREAMEDAAAEAAKEADGKTPAEEREEELPPPDPHTTEQVRSQRDPSPVERAHALEQSDAAASKVGRVQWVFDADQTGTGNSGVPPWQAPPVPKSGRPQNRPHTAANQRK
ncbi:MAG: TolC family protein [Planctomycetia bacterium]|nr:TolC family protein [Planctomycetia bacterium]